MYYIIFSYYETFIHGRRIKNLEVSNRDLTFEGLRLKNYITITLGLTDKNLSPID